jgi:hypothetical protein
MKITVTLELEFDDKIHRAVSHTTSEITGFVSQHVATAARKLPDVLKARVTTVTPA